MNERAVEERTGDFEEVETGFSMEEARREAGRCLSCRRCLGCGLCLAVCEPKAIVFDREDEGIDLIVDRVVVSPDVGVYMPLARGTFGYGEYRNVVSAFQFQRILDDDGPYGGLILRPYDGEIPEKIAFILDCGPEKKGAGDRDGGLLDRALEEAACALKKVEDLEISVFVSGPGDPLPLPAGEGERKGVRVRRGEVLDVKELHDTKNLLVVFMEEGMATEEEFGVLVIAGKTEIRPEIEELRRNC
jgi:heterodisulfide reductase subunit A